MSQSTPAPLPANEADRLRHLHRYDILDTPAEQDYDDFTVLASRLLNAPIALISLVDRDRQWFKSRVGLDVDSTPREVAFCAHAILGDDLFVVEDAALDARFAGSPLVCGHPNIRFYAGCPLISPEGFALGTLCVIDHTPRQLSDADADTLRRLSRQLTHLLELRRMDSSQRDAQRQLLLQASELQKLALVAERTSNVVIMANPDGLITWVNAAFERVTGFSLEDAMGRKPGALLQFEGTSQEARQQLRQAVIERKHTRVQILNRGKHDNVYWMDVDLQPLYNGDTFVGFVAMETDITELVTRQQQLGALLENLPMGLVLLDLQHQIRDLNTEAKRILLGNDGVEGNESESMAHAMAQVVELLGIADRERGEPSFRKPIAIRTRSNEPRWLDARVARLPHTDTEEARLIVAFSDQTEQIRAGRYVELAAETADVGYWTWNLTDDTLDLSDGWCERMGLSGNRHTTVDMVHPDDQLACKGAIADVLRGKHTSFKFEERLRRGDGSWCWVLCGGTVTGRDAQGRVTHMAGIHLDINEEKQAKEALRRAATSDPLTELPNRLVMLDRLNRALSLARRQGQYGAVLYLDLDHFKRINDTYGHGAGDRVLQVVSQRLQAQLRDADTLARMGGDEMMVLLPQLADTPDAAEVHAHAVSRKLIQVLRTPLELDGATVTLGTSVGITMFPKSATETVEDLVREADTAMYRAKGEERGSVRFYESSMHQEVTHRLRLEHDLRSAIDQRALQLFVQGKWSGDQRLVGGELLLRWNHPQRGWVPPSDFIPIAEESELIQGIGRFVLEEAARIARLCRQHQPDFVLSVNISPKQFGRREFIDDLQRFLRHENLSPDALLLEITEGVLLQEQLAKNAVALSEQGYRLSLDDFGTGYSSLAYLKRLPVYELKIDRAFVRDIEVDKDDAALVQAILSIARRFNIQTVAEGVESPGQLAFLAEQGCDLLQGYLFDRPQPWAQFVERYLTAP
jgi:diguanylate cyclase (GGDEF)-like protein/PAS domain S-box-containing protein